MIKSELRKIYSKKRKELSPNEIFSLSYNIIQTFILQFNPIENQNIHCFLPIEGLNEVNTTSLIEHCFEKKIKVFVPKVIGDNMISLEINKQTVLKKSNWGILEPLDTNPYENIDRYDFIITPLLYCDPRGNRIGYGKGYYDMFFKNIDGKKIGLSFFPPSEYIDDVRDDDVPLDYLITPSQVFVFKEKS